jgi:hypothetical protein
MPRRFDHETDVARFQIVYRKAVHQPVSVTQAATRSVVDVDRNHPIAIQRLQYKARITFHGHFGDERPSISSIRCARRSRPGRGSGRPTTRGSTSLAATSGNAGTKTRAEWDGGWALSQSESRPNQTAAGAHAQPAHSPLAAATSTDGNPPASPARQARRLRRTNNTAANTAPVATSTSEFGSGVLCNVTCQPHENPP